MPKLHPQIEAVLKAQAAAGLRPIEALTPAAARAQMEETARGRKAEPLPVAPIELVARFLAAWALAEVAAVDFPVAVTVPATALVACEPPTEPPDVLT